MTSTHPDNLATLPPLLIPTADVARLTGPAGAFDPVRIEITPGAPWFSVRVTDSGTMIRAADDTAKRAAIVVLAQLRNQYGATPPAIEVSRTRAPRFAVRGAMLDVSRDRIPTMDHFVRIVELLEVLGYNHLQLYTEHSFAYRGHEAAWRDSSPVTPEEARLLDAFASSRGIELAANQNCFGHLAHWLRLPEYRHLAETHGDWMFDVWPRSGPFSLCPTSDDSAEFVAGLLDQLLPNFTSPLVNIGCDETYDIGWGRSEAAVKARGKASVYADFVSRICALVRERGKRPMFWADIALSHPESLARLPSDLLPLAWGYEPDSPFDRWTQSLRALERPFWVCPGTSTWRAITSRTTERRGNLEAAARQPAEGYLVCDWGDMGHWQPWPLTAFALAEAAEFASRGPGVDAASLARAISLQVFGDRSLQIAQWLADLGDADLPLRESCGLLTRKDRTRLANCTALHADLFKPLTEARGVGATRDWNDTVERLESLAGSRPSIDAASDAQLDWTVRLALLAARRGRDRRRKSLPTPAQRAAIARELRDLQREHAELWALDSRPGGLAHSLSLFDQARAATIAARHAGKRRKR